MIGCQVKSPTPHKFSKYIMEDRLHADLRRLEEIWRTKEDLLRTSASTTIHTGQWAHDGYFGVHNLTRLRA